MAALYGDPGCSGWAFAALALGFDSNASCRQRVYYPTSDAGRGNVDTIDLIGSTMGLGFVAGMRLYATVFALGLAIRFGWLQLGTVGEPLRILAHPAVLIATGV